MGNGEEFGYYCKICINTGKGYFGFKYCPNCDLSVCSNCHDGERETDGILTMNWSLQNNILSRDNNK